MELKHVLLIEDNQQFGQELIDAFKGQGVDVTLVGDITELNSLLTPLCKFQMVILDWFLDGETSTLAKVCLQKIRASCFVPVVVYTEEREAFEGERDEVLKTFPEACLRGYSKSELVHDKLLIALTEWYETAPAKLSQHFRLSAFSAIEQALYSLAEQSSDDLARGLKTLIVLEQIGEIDMEHAVDVLVRLVSRAIYSDDNFINEATQVIKDLKLLNPPTTDKEKRAEKQKISAIRDLHMYYTPRTTDAVVRTGDIVEIVFADTQPDEPPLRCIVLTPACDLANAGKTIFLRTALIREAPSRTGNPPEDRWPLTDKGIKHEVCYHEILVVKDKTLFEQITAKDPKPKFVMSYAHEFTTLSGTPVHITRTKRLDEPYRSDMLHNFVSHAGRIGVPDLRRQYRNYAKCTALPK